MNLNLQDNKLRIELEWTEQLWAFHLSKLIEIPLTHITNISIEEPTTTWNELRAPGTFLPGVIKAGTYYTQRGREFWYATNRTNYLVLDLDNEYYRRIVLTLPGNETWVEQIRQQQSSLS